MKRTIFNLGFALLIGAISITSCSKKAEEKTKEATEAVAADAEAGAADVKEAVSDAATDVKEGAQDVASDVKEAASKTVDAIDSKLSKLSASARAEYNSFNKEIERLDEEIKTASTVEKAKLEKTKAIFVKKRDALLQ